jgi:hypothetical protein
MGIGGGSMLIVESRAMEGGPSIESLGESGSIVRRNDGPDVVDSRVKVIFYTIHHEDGDVTGYHWRYERLNNNSVLHHD